MEADEYLKKLYYDVKNPGSFSGPDKLYRVAKRDGKRHISLAKIKQWLSDQDAYSLQKPYRSKFRRRRVIVSAIDSQWDVDLADVSNISKYNDDIRFLLIAIDIFSRYLWVVPLRNKMGVEIVAGMKFIFAGGRKPWTMRTDKGREFNNKTFEAFITEMGVKHFVTQNETKANYAERVIRTVKDIMYRYFTANKTYRYLENLNELVANYNTRPHRSLGDVAPAEVTSTNEAEIWSHLYANDDDDDGRVAIAPKFTIDIGDQVRIASVKRTFQRTYDEKWTREVFVVGDRKLIGQILIYKLQDFAGDPISGTFYRAELQKVRKQNDALWEIEETVKRRGRGRKREVLVKWLGWPDKFNSWVPEKDIQKASASSL